MRVSISAADRLFSLLVRERAEHRCERCGRTDGKLDCSHIQPRGINVLRFDPDNAMCLCFLCHKWWHANPIESGIWCRNVVGEERYAYLLAKKIETFKFDRATRAHVLENLRSEWAEMQKLRHYGATGYLPFKSPYLGEVKPLPRKPRKAKKKARGPKRKIQSRPFPKAHRPLRRKAA